MQIDIASGLIRDARQVASPNADARPAGMQPDLVVIHSISLPPGVFGGPEIEQLFTNRLPAAGHPYFAEVYALRVSAHVLIRRDGELVQFVPFQHRAWHAGRSVYQGRENCNDFSIGIELEGTDDSAFAAEQYLRLAELIAVLELSYAGISRRQIAGHSEIAPGRKTDPGTGFDWDKLYTLLDTLPASQQTV